jgi:hypothetical protein
LILVANGHEEAEDPARVIQRLGGTSTRLVRLWIPKNNDIQGALNDGIASALREPLGEDEWILNVQSSATLGPDWLDATEEAMCDPGVGAVFGRLFEEENPTIIWADGHCFKEGRGDNCRRENCDGKFRFPCLSTCAIRRTLVEKIAREYGSLISYNAPHYCDCPDFAIRANAVEPRTSFKFVEKAVGYKRRPDINWRKLLCARLVLAAWYFRGHERAAEESVRRYIEKQQLNIPLWEIKADAARVLASQYSKACQLPPSATKCMDQEWSEMTCGNKDCRICFPQAQ